MASLTGKVAVVTDGSRRIGRAVAERLGKDEASIVVNYPHSADNAGEVISEIRSGEGSALAVQADPSELADIAVAGVAAWLNPGLMSFGRWPDKNGSGIPRH